MQLYIIEFKSYNNKIKHFIFPEELLCIIDKLSERMILMERLLINTKELKQDI